MTSLDTIYIRDLKIATQVGYFGWEQRIKQPIFFNIEMGVDTSLSAKSADIAHTIDYAVVAKRIEEHVATHSFVLVETLAEEIANLILTEFNVKKVKLQVSKPGILPNAKEVGVIIERRKKGQALTNDN